MFDIPRNGGELESRCFSMISQVMPSPEFGVGTTRAKPRTAPRDGVDLNFAPAANQLHPPDLLEFRVRHNSPLAD